MPMRLNRTPALDTIIGLQSKSPTTEEHLQSNQIRLNLPIIKLRSFCTFELTPTTLYRPWSLIPVKIKTCFVIAVRYSIHTKLLLYYPEQSTTGCWCVLRKTARSFCPLVFRRCYCTVWTNQGWADGWLVFLFLTDNINPAWNIWHSFILYMTFSYIKTCRGTSGFNGIYWIFHKAYSHVIQLGVNYGNTQIS